MMKRFSKNDGFTLIEVLGAILVLGLGILALNRSQISTLNTNLFANELTQATKLAQERIETLTSLPYADPLLNDTDGDGTGQDADFDGVDDNGGFFGLTHYGTPVAEVPDQTQVSGRYTVYWNVAIDQPITGTKTIRVIVRWTGKRNIAHSVVMDTVKGPSY